MMKTLLDTGFFSYIQENMEGNKISKSNQIKDVYEDFIKTLFAFCKSSGDNMSICFVLNYTRIEFVSIQKKATECESGKK
ncbi:hypothetical protein [Dysgonomonas termitidis]|uniref:Uncharacterized protein n=1 Tax=Dysgonomonas termitidis TaxID=1516126 RepID=A0ABV9KTJ7_9BACT